MSEPTVLEQLDRAADEICLARECLLGQADTATLTGDAGAHLDLALKSLDTVLRWAERMPQEKDAQALKKEILGAWRSLADLQAAQPRSSGLEMKTALDEAAQRLGSLCEPLSSELGRRLITQTTAGYELSEIRMALWWTTALLRPPPGGERPGPHADPASDAHAPQPPEPAILHLLLDDPLAMAAGRLEHLSTHCSRDLSSKLAPAQAILDAAPAALERLRAALARTPAQGQEGEGQKEAALAAKALQEVIHETLRQLPELSDEQARQVLPGFTPPRDRAASRSRA